MQYFKELPEILCSSIDKGSIIEIEVNGYVETVPDDRKNEKIIFVGRMGGTIYLFYGCVAEYGHIKAEDSVSGDGFTRLKVEGACVTAF